MKRYSVIPLAGFRAVCVSIMFAGRNRCILLRVQISNTNSRINRRARFEPCANAVPRIIFDTFHLNLRRRYYVGFFALATVNFTRSNRIARNFRRCAKKSRIFRCEYRIKFRNSFCVFREVGTRYD